MKYVQLEHYAVSQSFGVLSTTDYSEKSHSSANLTVAINELDPTANLTFDLRLSSKEKEERSKVVLPYTAAAVRDGVGVAPGAVGHTSRVTGGGQIYYQLDDVDDFDESDPDDDLDI